MFLGQENSFEYSFITFSAVGLSYIFQKFAKTTKNVVLFHSISIILFSGGRPKKTFLQQLNSGKFYASFEKQFMQKIMQKSRKIKIFFVLLQLFKNCDTLLWICQKVCSCIVKKKPVVITTQNRRKDDGHTRLQFKCWKTLLHVISKVKACTFNVLTWKGKIIFFTHFCKIKLAYAIAGNTGRDASNLQ